MSKKTLLIGAGGIVLLLAVIIFFFMRGRGGNGTEVTPTPDASVEPSAPTDDPIFTTTPSPVATSYMDVCPANWTNLPDGDKDGLPDKIEAVYKSNQTVADTDSDNYSDGQEVKNGYDPVLPGSARLDSDNDELFDNEECNYKTDSFNPDTDGDGYKDGTEVKNGYDPYVPGSARLSTTPTPSAVPSSTPIGGGTTGIVSVSELKITKDSSATAIKTYLDAVDKNSPTELTSGNQFTEAIMAAFKGNTAALEKIITRLKQYESAVLKITTPEPAVNHQLIFVTLIRLVNMKLQAIVDAKGDAQKQFSIVLELRNLLPEYLEKLQTERNKLNAMVK